MKITGFCFTLTGAKLLLNIKEGLEKQGHIISCYAPEDCAAGEMIMPFIGNLQEFAGKLFDKTDAFVFVGATGIAVRTIAPFLVSKTTDPAVVVADEIGCYVISLLSGHLGGANELARNIASLIKAEPVITTATDLQKKFAVDLFADQNDLVISDMTLAKEVSAKVLKGGLVGCYSDYSFQGSQPDCFGEEELGLTELGLYIGIRTDKRPYKRTLHLIPKIITLGIGCRKETSCDTLLERVMEVLQEERISVDSLAQVASVDLKKEEKGILELCQNLKLPFVVYSAEQLSAVRGVFADSDFVEGVTGVGNVCERAAVLASGGTVICKKNAKNGVTIALAVKEWRIRFE